MKYNTIAFCGLAATTVMSMFLNVEQHGVITMLRGVAETAVTIDDEYIVRAAEQKGYVRGYHQATEDVNCPPDADVRAEAIRSWKKKNLTNLELSLEEKQDEVARKIKLAIQNQEK
jgi:hypothetical protein